MKQRVQRSKLCFLVMMGTAVLFTACSLSQFSGEGATTVTPTTPNAGVSVQETATAVEIVTWEQTRIAEDQAHLNAVDDFSRDLINLMLDSHNRWQTLQADINGHWDGDTVETQRHKILIRQPYSVRISGTDYQAILGEDDEEQEQIAEAIQRLPTTFEEIKPITIYPYPALGFRFAGDNIFPTGLAQRGGRYKLIAEESILDRLTWVVDWYDVRNGGDKRNRFWIDKETGIILKLWGYDGAGEKYEEIELTSLILDEPIPDEAFQKGRTINGRLVAAEDKTKPVPGVLLRLGPDGEPVAQTDANGRFTIPNAPIHALRLYAQRLDYAIPAGTEPALDLGDVVYPPLQSLILPLSDYPPSPTPYWIGEGDFWLVHTPEGQLFAFAPVSPPYAADIDVDECRYIWDKSGQRFIDPCSGDKWELDGQLNLEHSMELWSNRNLDQYGIHAIEEMIAVQFSPLIPGLLVDDPPLAIDVQNGITLTAVTADFSPEFTIIDTLVLVDPLWQMDPTAFPPQQALTSFTISDSLIDDQGRGTAPTSREGEPAVFDSSTGAFRQVMHNRWRPIATEADTVTATLTIELLNLTRHINVPLNWDSHQVGDVWDVDVPLEIGYAGAQIRQVEWLETSPDGGDDDSTRLRLTVTDASPDDIRLYCLYLETSTLDERTCPNFEGELTYTVDVQPGKPVALYLLAALSLERPFTLFLDVMASE